MRGNLRSDLPKSGLLDFRLVHEHDWDVILDGIHAVTLGAFQIFRILPIFKRLFASRTDQHFQQFLRKHVHHFTSEAFRFSFFPSFFVNAIHSEVAQVLDQQVNRM